MDLKGKSMLQHMCHSKGARCSMCKQNLTYVVVNFDYFGVILDSICSLDIVTLYLFGYMLYFDDSLLCESQNCHRCTIFT